MKWKRIIGRTLAGFALLLIVAAVGGYFYLKSSSFQSFAIRQIVDRANLATGGKIEIGRLDFELGTLTAHLHNITLHGTESADQPPLLHADELTVRLRIISALRRQVALRELLLARPVVHVQVDRDGKNNLPSPPPSQGSGSKSIFDLAIEHAQLTNGEVNYNDRKIPLEADLYDLGTDVHFESLAKRYSGELSYKNGRLHYADYAPLAHNLDLKFSATPERFDVSPADFEIGSSSITLHAQLQNYSNPTAEGDYKIRLHTADFASLSPSTKPAGDVSLAGKLQYRPSGNQPTLRDISVDGQIASDLFSAVTSGNRVELRRLQGTYRLADGNLEVKNLSLESMGGRVNASAQMKHLDKTLESSVQASLFGISLKDVQRALGRQQLPGAALSGTLRGQIQAGWKGPIDNLRARADLLVQATASSRSNPAASDVPVNGAIHAAYDGPRQTIELNDTVIKIPSATLTAQGSVSNHSNLQLKMVANNLQQLAALAASFSAAQTSLPSVSGSATVDATVQGSVQKPAITAHVDAENLEVEGSAWKSAKIALHANPSGVVIENALLVNVHRGQATLAANVALNKWEYDSSNPIKAHLEVQQMSISDLLDLAKQHYPVSGDLSANLNIEGSQLHPSGSGSAQIANAHAYGETIQTLSAKFHTENDAVISTLTVSAPAGTIDGNLSYTPKTRAYKARINAPALVLQKLQAVQAKNLGISGTLAASLSGEGTVDDPQLEASLRLPQLQIQQNTISAFDAELHVAQHTANVTLDSQVAQAAIHARGTVGLTGDFQTEANVDTGTIPLAPLVAAYASGTLDGFQGQAEMHATLKGPLKDASKIEAHISIPTLKATYRSLEIGISQPVRADYADSVVTLQPAELKGTGTSLRAQGRIPIRGTAPPTLTAQGSVDVRVLQIFAPTLQSSGSVALDVRSSGSAISGQLQFQNVAMATPDAPIGVSKMNGTVDIANDHVQISKMTAEMGGGTVSVGGSVTYKPNIQFNIALQGQSIRLRYPEGLRSLIDANLAFTGSTQASTLSGRVLLDSLSFTPDFDLSKFADQFSTGNQLSQPGFADTIKLAINAQSQQSLNAVSSQVSIAGQIALQVGGTAANPVITGRTTLTSGELFYRNVRYQLQRGLITFDNPNETHPVLNVSVTTTVEQYNLTLTMRGPLDKLTTSYVSDPPLATADIINLVARGQTTEESAASSQSTDSMVASEAASQLSSSVQKLAGISSLQIDPTLGGNSNPSARIAIQQRVTKNLLFSFSTDVSQPGSEIVQGEYQFNKRWSVSVQRDQLGGVAVDGRYHTRF
jgi:translocation and assembly module TamB